MRLAGSHGISATLVGGQSASRQEPRIVIRQTVLYSTVRHQATVATTGVELERCRWTRAAHRRRDGDGRRLCVACRCARRGGGHNGVLTHTTRRRGALVTAYNTVTRSVYSAHCTVRTQGGDPGTSLQVLHALPQCRPPSGWRRDESELGPEPLTHMAMDARRGEL